MKRFVCILFILSLFGSTEAMDLRSSFNEEALFEPGSIAQQVEVSMQRMFSFYMKMINAIKEDSMEELDRLFSEHSKFPFNKHDPFVRLEFCLVAAAAFGKKEACENILKEEIRRAFLRRTTEPIYNYSIGQTNGITIVPQESYTRIICALCIFKGLRNQLPALPRDMVKKILSSWPLELDVIFGAVHGLTSLNFFPSYVTRVKKLLPTSQALTCLHRLSELALSKLCMSQINEEYPSVIGLPKRKNKFQPYQIAEERGHSEIASLLDPHTIKKRIPALIKQLSGKESDKHQKASAEEVNLLKNLHNLGCEENTTDSKLQCTVCQKKPNSGTRLKRCSLCKTVRYCSQECQRADWIKHKNSCAPYSRQQRSRIAKTLFKYPLSVTLEMLKKFVALCPDCLTWRDKNNRYTFLHCIAPSSQDEELIQYILVTAGHIIDLDSIFTVSYNKHGVPQNNRIVLKMLLDYAHYSKPEKNDYRNRRIKEEKDRFEQYVINGESNRYPANIDEQTLHNIALRTAVNIIEIEILIDLAHPFAIGRVAEREAAKVRIKKHLFESPKTIYYDLLFECQKCFPDFLEWIDNDGNTLLHILAKLPVKKFFKAKNKEERHYAIDYERTVKILLGFRPDLTCKNIEGLTVKEISNNDIFFSMLKKYQKQPWLYNHETGGYEDVKYGSFEK